jgi:penicillin-binding protein 1B
MAAEISFTRPPIGMGRRKLVVHRKVENDDWRGSVLPFVQVAAFLFSLALTLSLGVVISAYRNFSVLIDQQIASGYLRSRAGFYAAPRVIEKGARMTKEQLAATLQKAGYTRNTASNIWNGSFEVNDDDIRILPRRGTESHEWVSVKFDNRGYISSLIANDRTDLTSYSLEPELLTADAGIKEGKQQTLTFQQLPPVLVQAILSIEDRRFFEHNGLDARGISRAMMNFISNGKLHFTQGGSTITQQLVKNAYLTPEKTLARKFNEAVIALALENRLSKEDIFALYCNDVYLGQRGGVGVRGVAQAAKVFFGKDLKDLSLDEAAIIAGMIQSPARYAPDRHPEEAKQRRDRVIAAMVRDGAVSSDQGQVAQTLPVQVAPFESAGNQIAPYYVDLVNRALEGSSEGLDGDTDHVARVQTTIDPDLQAAAERALLQRLDALSKTSRENVQPQGAMVALDPHTGQVLAMVGGRNYAESQLNRATDAKRQPGSVFKPFVYAAALEAGISPLATYNDTPQTFQYGNATYSPANFGKSYSMHDVLMREGLIRSLNVVTVELAMQTGLASVANTAARFGLTRPAPYPALALGTTEVTPLQVASAYAAFVNDGKLVQPTVVAGVMDGDVQTSSHLSPPATQVIQPTTAYMITDMLASVTTRGTARRAKSGFKNVAIAGKTGTSRDGWYVGYTPNLVCAVWIGYDDNTQLGLTGADAALPVWIDFVKEALAIRPSLGGGSFIKPAGITTVKIDPETGFLAGPDCPTSEVVSIASRFAPVTECYKHRPELPELLLSDGSGAELLPGESETDAAARAANNHPQTSLAPSSYDEANALADSDAAQPTRVNQPTRKDLNQRNRPVLVNDLKVPDKKLVTPERK